MDSLTATLSNGQLVGVSCPCYSGLVSLSLGLGRLGSLASQSVMGLFGIAEFDLSGQPFSEFGANGSGI